LSEKEKSDMFFNPLEGATFDEIWLELAKRYENCILLVTVEDDNLQCLRTQKSGSFFTQLGMLEATRIAGLSALSPIAVQLVGDDEDFEEDDEEEEEL